MAGLIKELIHGKKNIKQQHKKRRVSNQNRGWGMCEDCGKKYAYGIVYTPEVGNIAVCKQCAREGHGEIERT